LGPVEVRRGGEALSIAGSRRRALLVRLVVSANQPVTFDRLVEDVWDGDPAAGGRSTLASHVGLLRQILGPARISTRDGGYLLEAGPEEIDVSCFEADLAAGEAALQGGDPGPALDHLTRALAWWRGPALADVAGSAWAGGQVTRLEEQRRRADEAVLRARLDLGQHEQAATAAQVAVNAQPLREQRWALLMLALYRGGRQAEALRAFQGLRAILAEELGIEPSADLVALEKAIILQKPQLDWQPVDAEKGRAAHRSQPVRHRAGEPLGHNIPAPSTSLVGREAELADVDRLLDCRRLVTITGTGGVGKTRLALAAARARFGSFPHGVWLVELATERDPARVTDAVVGVLGLQGDPGRPLIDVIGDAIGDSRTLLVLDNCEHLIDATAHVVAHLLALCPKLAVLATSREPLRVEGESTFVVSPLSLPPTLVISRRELAASTAVTLFVERVHERGPEVSLDGSEGDTAGRLCRRLDGLPLALELAAARSGSLSLSDLERQLSDRFRWLTNGRRNALPRQQTLWATIDWSFGLLDPDEQSVCRVLSVFVGSFDMRAATRVCGRLNAVPEDDVALAMASLVDKNLVVADHTTTTTRYRMLETIREYAAARLAEEPPGAVEAAETAHTEHYLARSLALAPLLSGPSQVEYLAELVGDVDNIRLVLRRLTSEPGRANDLLSMLVALNRFWYLRPLEGHQYFLAAHDHLQNVEPALRGRALCGAYEVGVKIDRAGVRSYPDEALALARQIGDQELAAWAEINGACQGFLDGDASTPARARDALALARSTDNHDLIVKALAVATRLDRLGNHGHEWIDFTRSTGDVWLFAGAIHEAGRFAFLTGDLDTAHECFAQIGRTGISALEGDAATDRLYLGWIAQKRSDFVSATDHYLSVLPGALRNRVRSVINSTAIGLACCAEARHQWEVAARLLGYVAGRHSDMEDWGDPDDLFEAESIGRLQAHYAGFDEAFERGRAMTDGEFYDLVLDSFPVEFSGHADS
jgi:predicted ATPase/DNA-binding SARP family transcriptional activator